MSISNMIDTIRRRPGMFLGKNSISALRHFLDGYQAAEREYALFTEELFPLPFWYMHEYTGYRLQEHNNKGWCLQLLQACDGSEEAALWKFFEFYDDFRQIGMKRYWKAVLSEENIAWNNQLKKHMHDREPLTVYVVELTISACIFAVETSTDIRLEFHFFSSPADAREHAETYFGPISHWEESAGQTLSFGNKIVPFHF